jgi:hypothetical protein
MKYLLEKELRFALNNLPPCSEDSPPVYDIPLYKTAPLMDFDLDAPSTVAEAIPPYIRFRRRQYIEPGYRRPHWVWVLEEIPERE